MTLLAGVVLFVIAVAWLTVVAMGRGGPAEEEFERLVRRSEELATSPQLASETGEFDLLVAEAIDRLPAEFHELLEDTPVVVSRRGAEAGAYGHYFGGGFTRGEYEHRIVLYQDTLERDFGGGPGPLRAPGERAPRPQPAPPLRWGGRGGPRGGVLGGPPGAPSPP